MQRKIKEQQRAEEKKAEEASRRERLLRGIWHDGRLDCVAGNGVMSELGFGDELLTDADMDDGWHLDGIRMDVNETEMVNMVAAHKGAEEKERKLRNVDDTQAVGTLPIVVIRNFAAKGGANREELLSVLAIWAASLVENQVSK